MSWYEKIREVVLGPRISDELLDEKRITPRVNCSIDASFSSGEGAPFEGTIIVLEYTGMRCTVPMELEKGTQLQVTARKFMGGLAGQKDLRYDALQAEVVWCRKSRRALLFEAGMRFTDQPEVIAHSWVNLVLDSLGISKLKGFQQRRLIRVTSDIPVECIYGMNMTVRGTIVNIGLGGLKTILDIELKPGKEAIFVIGPHKKLGLVKIRGKVLRSAFARWCQKFETGVKFIEPDNNQLKTLSRYLLAVLKEQN